VAPSIRARGPRQRSGEAALSGRLAAAGWGTCARGGRRCRGPQGPRSVAGERGPRRRVAPSSCRARGRPRRRELRERAAVVPRRGRVVVESRHAGGASKPRRGPGRAVERAPPRRCKASSPPAAQGVADGAAAFEGHGLVRSCGTKALRPRDLARPRGGRPPSRPRAAPPPPPHLPPLNGLKLEERIPEPKARGGR